VDQDVGVLKRGFHALGIGDEIRREVAAVELHAFHDFELGFERLGLFNRDDAILADLLHGLGDDLADGLIVVGGDGADLGDHVAADRLGVLIELALAALARLLVDFTGDDADGLLDAALQRHRIRARRNRLHAFAIDRLGKNGGGGGAVAGHVGSLGRNLAHHLGAHVLERVLQFNFLRYGDAVLGNGRRTEFLFDHHIAALGAEGDFDRVRQKVDAAENRLARLLAMNNLLCH
jgi:hypothetical protein